ncbi:MAG: ATP-binding protein [Treponema sp.]|nr:ATP-binding protein [Treponema sp.]
MLSSEIETTLGGRYLTKFIYPYNVREFLLANEMIIDEKSMLQTKTIGKIKRLFDDYYTFGGFPETVLYKNKREYISRVYQKILLGDIATRNNIHNSAGLKILIKKIAETVKDTISYSKLHIAYSISNISNNREIKSLVILASEMDEVKNFIIIPKEEEQILEASGITIKVVPALKWLLQ